MERKILEHIQEIAAKKGEQITSTTDLFSGGILDSLEIISLLGYLQMEFSISFMPEDLQFENYQTVEKIIAWTKKHVG